jgi:4-phytase/acid phosphatase/peptide/nickel transport system substrate-binding protein
MDGCANSMEMRRFGGGAMGMAALIVCMIVVLVVFPASVPAAGPRLGGRLVFGVESNDFVGFDVLKARGGATADAFANITIHERLFGLDEKGNLSPMLALSAEPSADRKSWTIHLRQGVVFHDGTPFNADAVVQHWSRMLDPANKFQSRFIIQPIQSVTRVDDHTVRFQLEHPWILFPLILSSSRGAMITIPSPAAVSADKQNRAPVGTGPFMFKEWRSADHFVVVKNPHYWQQGKPLIEEIVFRFMPDHQTRFAALKAGDVDMIWMDRGQIIRKAMEDPKLAVLHAEDNGAEILILNTSKPPFDDVRVRQALAHAWNQQQYVKLSYQDCIPSVVHPFGKEIACGDCGYREHDPEKAKKLLADYGKPVAFECLHSDTARGQEAGVILQQFGKSVGMEVTPVGLAFGPIVKKVMTGDFQASTWRIPSVFDLGPYMSLSFHSQSKANSSKYASPEMDVLVAEQWRTTDPKEREKLLCAIAERINRDVPIIYRGGEHHYVIATKYVKGIPAFQNGVIDITEAWLQK